MFYINKILFAAKDSLPPVKDEGLCENPATVKTEVEKIPEELLEDLGTLPDALLEEENVLKPTTTSMDNRELNKKSTEDESTEATKYNVSIFK